MIEEGNKVKLKTGEIALISEVLENQVAYIAEVFIRGGGVSVDEISHDDIVSVFIEVEQQISKVNVADYVEAPHIYLDGDNNN